MKTKELEVQLGVTKQALIYYEKEGLIKPKRDANNYRNYSEEDVEIIKLILFLRSLEITIDEIKLILKEELSIREVLKTKRANIEKTLVELNDIEEIIKTHVKRKKVAVSIDGVEDKKEYDNYDKLIFQKDCIVYKNIIIKLNTIKEIKVTMFSYSLNLTDKKALGGFILARGYGGYAVGLGGMLKYGIDLDIQTNRDVYSFSVDNSGSYHEMMKYFKDQKIPINDPLNIVDLYINKTDSVYIEKYLQKHFAKWAKDYGLDNPRKNY